MCAPFRSWGTITASGGSVKFHSWSWVTSMPPWVMLRLAFMVMFQSCGMAPFGWKRVTRTRQ